MIIGKTSLAFDSAANGVFELFDQYPYVILWDFIVYLYAKITMTTMATKRKRGTAWRRVPLCFLGGWLELLGGGKHHFAQGGV